MADDRCIRINSKLYHITKQFRTSKTRSTETRDKKVKLLFSKYININRENNSVNKSLNRVSTNKIKEDTNCHGVKPVYIILHKPQCDRYETEKIYNSFKHASRPKSIRIYRKRKKNEVFTLYSLPEIKINNSGKEKLTTKGSDIVRKKSRAPFRTQFVVNAIMENPPRKSHPYNNIIKPNKLKIYRCQIGGKEESCCCKCNSDAMFEVMKSLYDCYKKKDCNHCNCILCSHLPREERRLGELRKTAGALESVSVQTKKKEIDKKTKDALVAMEGKSPAEKEKILKELAMAGVPLPEPKTASEKAIMKKVRAELGMPPESKAAVPSEKMRKAKMAGLLTPLEGKTKEQKEKILKGLTQAGIPLPEPKTASEKQLINKIRTEVGLPPQPKTAAEREKYKKATALGIITPLEGKTAKQKEKILKAQQDIGLPLPEGRTASERALISKIKASPRKKSEAPKKIPSEKLRKAKEEGLLTPLDGKTSEQKEKILKGLVKHGLPLPEPKTASEKKMIDKVKAATAAGIMTPLEGKTPAQKEKILREQAEKGIPLPEGKTPSEKALIKKIKESIIPIPSEKLRKAKAAGLITPLDGKSPEQKEKILKGLVMHGIPLPDGKTSSERKLINKVRLDMGLPPEPKSDAEKKKYNKAIAAGMIQPLEGKSESEKKKILKAQHDMGIELPEARTPSEKALIAATKRMPKEVPMPIPSEKLRKAKAAGLITPLEGKTPEQKEKIIKGLAMQGLPLPEGTTPSEKKIINKMRTELGLPLEPKTAQEKEKYNKALNAGIIEPLEGKSKSQKEKILKAQHDMGIALPEGRTPSEKAMIAAIKGKPKEGPIAIPSEKLRKAKADGLITPLDGKTQEQKEKIIKGLAMQGLPLPEGTTPSEKKIINKMRTELGLPPEPKTAQEKDKYNKALKAGIVEPLEGKSKSDKEKILKAQHDMGIQLPEGRTASEKALIAAIKGMPKEAAISMPSEKLRKAKAAGLITPLEGKTPEQKQKIIKGLAMQGLPLPDGTTTSDKKIINKMRAELGMPPEPKTAQEKQKYDKALKAGIIEPLEGKSKSQKEKILKAQHDMGIELPEGRTASEKALIAEIKGMPKEAAISMPSEKLRKAKAAGLMTPLKGKAPEQKEKIIKGLAMQGLPLPEGTTPSDKKIIDKMRTELGLPPEPKTAKEKEKYNKALKAGIIEPLEGKSKSQKEKILKAQHNMGIPLPEGRTPSEKALIATIKELSGETPVSIPSEKLRKAKAAGLITPLKGKTPEQKEKIIKGLAMQGLPLPEGTTPSEKKIINKMRAELGLPPEPTTAQEKENYNKALKAGIIEPLEGKSKSQKEKILKAQHNLGIALPEGRTPSEKALIAAIKRKPKEVAIPSEKLRKAKASGLITPLEGKTPEQKQKIIKGLAMQGLPLPEGTTPSDKKIINKMRAELGLPPEPKTAQEKEKYDKALKAGIIEPLEGKSKSQKEKILKAQHDMGIALPEGRTSSEKALIATIKGMPAGTLISMPSEKLRKAKAAGLITPLKGKAPEQKEKIIKGLAMQGLPLPEGTTPSDKKIIDKMRAELGLPPEPKTTQDREKYDKALKAGIIEPLEGKSKSQKEKILKAQHNMGIPLPEGRTPSERALIATIKGMPKEAPISIPSEKLRKAKAAGLITPLKGKAPEQKEKIIKGLAMQGLPLPEGTTPSDKKIIDKIRAELGLPPEPKTTQDREKYDRALKAGIIEPLEGKSKSQKEKILKAQHNMGIPLPEGRTPSERALITTIKGMPKEAPTSIPSEKLRKAKAAGLITPLEGKTPEQKEKIIKGLAMQGLPLPEGATSSDKKMIDKMRSELGLPPEPKSALEREKYNNALKAGIIEPLEGKSKSQKEKILKAQHDIGIALPEGRTPSEKALISEIKASPRRLSGLPATIPSEKLRKAKAAGFLTPLQGKSSDQKEKILKGLAMHGVPLPEGKTASEKKLIEKVKAQVGLPPSPKTTADKNKYDRALVAGIITPLEGKSASQKEKILQAQYDMGLPLPDGRTSSEKALIEKIKTKARAPSSVALAPSEKLKKAKAAGLLTPLEGKTSEQKEKILRGLAKAGVPLPDGKTLSDKKLISKVRQEIGLPPEPETASMKEKYKKAYATGIITPLEGKTPSQKEKALRKMHQAGIPLPEGNTSSERALIKKIKAEPITPLEGKRSGVSTPLKGKTSAQQEKIIRKLAKSGKPLPEGKTASEKMLIDKVRKDLGLPPEPKTSTMREKLNKAYAAGIITPLNGKSSKQKENILRGMINAGVPLPEGRTPSEKAMITKIQADVKVKPSKKEIIPSPPLTSDQRQKLDKKTAKAVIEGKGPVDECICSQLAPPSERVELSEKRPSMKKIPSEKIRKAKAAGLLTPLQGKSRSQKEKILKGLVETGLPLPEGKTPSEKSMIQKLKAETGKAMESKTLFDKEVLRKAKAEGLLTPLAGKTASQKEQIVKGLIAAGLPVPEGKTASEKAIIKKIRKEAGLPPEPTPSEKKRGIPSTKKTELRVSKAVTPSQKDIVEKTKKEGLLTPLTGKSQAQKEKIIRGLAAAGLTIPEGTTSSEKELIKKIRAEEGLPSETRGKIQSKSKKFGVERKSVTRGVGGRPPPAGVTEEFEDIIKTTTCDRGCGCDKKKIKFKHSYVKIKVTSPDISSLCPCPDDCFPMKTGVITDNEGIKVTVGRVTGIPSFSADSNLRNKRYEEFTDLQNSAITSLAKQSIETHQVLHSKENMNVHISYIGLSVEYLFKNNAFNFNFSDDNFTASFEYYDYEKNSSNKDNELGNQSYYNISSEKCFCATNTYSTRSFTRSLLFSTKSSHDSLIVVKTDSSLNLDTNSYTSETISIISFVGSSFTSSTSQYLISEHETFSVVSMCESEYITVCVKDYDTPDKFTSYDKAGDTMFDSTEHVKSRQRIHTDNEEISIYMVSKNHQSKGNFTRKMLSKENSVVMITEYSNDRIIGEINNPMTRQISSMSLHSSLYLVMPTSEDNNSESSVDSVDSTVCIHISQNVCNWGQNEERFQTHLHREDVPYAMRGFKFKSKGKLQKNVTKEINKGNNLKRTYKADKQTSHNSDKHLIFKEPINGEKETATHKPVKIYKVVSVDTIRDRPCCCTPKEQSQEEFDINDVSTVVSEIITPIMIKQGVAQANILEFSSSLFLQWYSEYHRSHLLGAVCSFKLDPAGFGAEFLTNEIQNTTGLHRDSCIIPMRKKCSKVESHSHDNVFRHKMPIELYNLGPKDQYNYRDTGNQVKIAKISGPVSKPIVDTQGCQCSPEKLMQMFEEKLKEMTSVGVGNIPMVLPVKQPEKSTLLTTTAAAPTGLPLPQCDSCLPEPKRGSCLCDKNDSKYLKKKRKRQCPCQIHKDKVTPKKCQCCRCKENKGRYKCHCHGKKKNLCECPPEPEHVQEILNPEPPHIEINEQRMKKLKAEFKELDRIGKMEELKMMSGMTQTTSGFRIKFKKRPPVQDDWLSGEDMSFEDALVYFQEHPEEGLPEGFTDDEACKCDENQDEKIKKLPNCECPEVEPSVVVVEATKSEIVEEPTLKGFKLVIEGKGSGSKGLSGVICFEKCFKDNS